VISIEEFKQQLDQNGWIVLEKEIPDRLIEQMALDLETCYKACREIQIENKVAADTSHTVHHLIGQKDSFLDFLNKLPTDKYMESYFDGKFILNSFGGAINLANTTSYAHNIHRDIRSFSGELPILLNTLVMLDDFTPDNGATLLMSGSHRMEQKPTEEEFKARQEQALGPAGSILIFNSNLWHRGGLNTTDKPRRSVAPMFSKPYFKPQFDYCRALGYEKVENLSDNLQQVLGYYSRIPSSLHEWYQPIENRAYRSNQL